MFKFIELLKVKHSTQDIIFMCIGASAALFITTYATIVVLKSIWLGVKRFLKAC